jgi:2-oxoglutarate ferredoxin oxidoreductase subunit alpha
MAQKRLSITVAGSGGAGVMTVGNALLEAAGLTGWYAHMVRSSGPQIRGGEVAAMICVSPEPITSEPAHCDLLLAIDWKNIDRFGDEISLTGNSLVVCDPELGQAPASIGDSAARCVEVPLQRLAGTIKGGRPNMVALGVAVQMVGIPRQFVQATLEKVFQGDQRVKAAMAGVDAGFAAAPAADGLASLPLPTAPCTGRWSITGNEATALGALHGGVRFAAGYPITPATEILEWLALTLPKIGGTFVQAEDELAAINQVIGASFGGVPAITATAGPGFALMMESIGLAVAAEVPAVVVNVMRGGPSTGIPTKSEQADLNIALYGLPGDAPHLVVAPTSVNDCLNATQWAVHLSECLQSPAIVLSSQALGQTRIVDDKPVITVNDAARDVPEVIEDNYQRYRLTPSGVSPMSLPGMAGGRYTAEGLEHNEAGIPSVRAGDHLQQLNKRRDKLTRFDYGEYWADIQGAGSTAIITWGAPTGAAWEQLACSGKFDGGLRLIALRLLAPEQPERMAAALDGVSRLLVVEHSHGGQFYKYLRSCYDLPDDTRLFCRPGPLPILAAEIACQLEQWNKP